MNQLTPEGLVEAAGAIKAIKYGDPNAEVSEHEEVGFLMLAKVFHCFVADHSPARK